MFKTMDYLTIGGNEFAQLGSPDFFQKDKEEMRRLIDLVKSSCRNLYRIPNVREWRGVSQI